MSFQVNNYHPHPIIYPLSLDDHLSPIVATWLTGVSSLREDFYRKLAAFCEEFANTT